MNTESRPLTSDQKVQKLIKDMKDIIDEYDLIPDRRVQWFSSGQLDDVRKIMETHGAKTACAFLVSKAAPDDFRLEATKCRALADITVAASKSGLQIVIAAYMVGFLNTILADVYNLKPTGGQTYGK